MEDEHVRTNIVAASLLLVFFVLSMGFTLIMCTSCTYSINMIHTAGSSTDVVDENQKADADVSPTLTIPAKVL